MSFPVDVVLQDAANSLAANRMVVLQAPPGSGKTTRAAPYLLSAPWLQGKKILLLEPRRLAARSAASFMARQCGERVGQTIGYRIRLENRTTSETRIEILTEGLLAQRLLSDPELSDAGLVIFDEFHERNLPADFSLALALDSRSALRPDLRIMVMSATLDAEPIAVYLGEADVITALGKMFPVETRYLRKNPTSPIFVTVADAVCRAVAEERGSVLAFLPGEGEIRSTVEELGNRRLPDDVSVHPLYGALNRADQDRAIEPAASGKRKVVLATAIAESSLTIEGIRVVIDSGWMRVPRFSPRNGMSRLETLRITRDRADQRRGRAGRVCPGVCYRLWDEAADRMLEPQSLPEILDADLAPLVLQCADWGTADRLGLPWLTPPPDAAWRQAISLLKDLGALDQTPSITSIGRRLARFPIHPRLAYAIERAADFGVAREACEWAAAITESPSLPWMRRETDLRGMIDYLHAHPDLPVAKRVKQLAENWYRGGRIKEAPRKQYVSEGVILAWAFPERIARRRNASSGSYLMRNGRGAILEKDDPLLQEEWLVAVELQDGSADAKIRLAVPISVEEIREFFGTFCEHVSVTFWDKKSESVQSVRRCRLGAATLSEGNDPEPDPERRVAVLCEAVRQKGVDQLPWTKHARALRERVCFLHRLLPEEQWPDFSDAALAEGLERWFAPFCSSISKWSQIEHLDLTQMLLTDLESSGCARTRLDASAPMHVIVPSGSKIAIHYEAESPYIAVRIQEVFGMTRTPRVANGRVPVVMHLLSPAQRPVQVTGDLESFWKTGYTLIRKDLRGRYPKHYWPEDPTLAIATRRVRPPKHS